MIPLATEPFRLMLDLEDYLNLGKLPPGETCPRALIREALALLRKTVPHYLDRFD